MLARMAEQYGPKIAETFDGIGRSISEFLDPYINDPKTWTVTTQAELKFKQLEMADMAGSGGPPPFWDNLLGRFEDWYESSGKQMLMDGATQIAQDFASFLESSGPAITKAAASIGGKIAFSLIDGYFAGMRDNPVGQGILQLAPAVGHGANVKGLYDWLFSSESPDDEAYHGIDYVPRDGYTTKLHKGERVLTAEENREFASGGGAPVVNISMNGLTIREEADIEKIAYRIAREINAGT